MTTQHKHYKIACQAYYGISFNPEKRAESECAFFDEIMTEFSDNTWAQEKFEKLFLECLSAKSRCLSSMISGPANFPVRRNQKATDREHKLTGELLKFIESVRTKKNQEEYYIAHPEARPIMSGDANAIDSLKEKLAALEAQQIKMVEANKENRGTYESFSLTNNRAKINATRDRIIELENRKASTPKDFIINGVRCFENTEIMRLQLFFEGKPDEKIRTTLKSNGFKWAPSQSAWQRILTGNAINSFNHSIKPMLSKGQL